MFDYWRVNGYKMDYALTSKCRTCRVIIDLAMTWEASH
jgi:hypothetical protein